MKTYHHYLTKQDFFLLLVLLAKKNEKEIDPKYTQFVTVIYYNFLINPLKLCLGFFQKLNILKLRINCKFKNL